MSKLAWQVGIVLIGVAAAPIAKAVERRLQRRRAAVDPDDVSDEDLVRILAHKRAQREALKERCQNIAEAEAVVSKFVGAPLDVL